MAHTSGLLAGFSPNATYPIASLPLSVEKTKLASLEPKDKVFSQELVGGVLDVSRRERRLEIGMCNSPPKFRSHHRPVSGNILVPLEFVEKKMTNLGPRIDEEHFVSSGKYEPKGHEKDILSNLSNLSCPLHSSKLKLNFV